MKKLIIALFSSLLVFTSPALAFAQEQPTPEEIQQIEQLETAPVEEHLPEKFYLAQVKEILEDKETDLGDGTKQPYQKLKLVILNSDEKGKEIEIEHGNLYSISDEQKVSKGNLIVLTKSFEGGEMYYIADRFRIHLLAITLTLIVLVWAILGRGRNLGTIVALIGSFALVFYYLIPQLRVNPNPYQAIAISSLGILALLVFVGIGVSKKSLLVFASTLVTTLLVFSVTYLLFKYTNFTATQNEKSSFYLQNGILEPTALKNMFLASIVLGTLAISTFLANRQVNLVEDIKTQSKKLSLSALYKKILINSENNLSPLMAIIFIAYLALNLTLVLLFTVNPNLPFWVTFNSEYMLGEVLRILITMAGVVLVVPVTTYLAVNFLPKGK